MHGGDPRVACGLAGLNHNRNIGRDPIWNRIGSESGMKQVRASGHVADLERAVRAGLHRPLRPGRKISRLIGLQRQLRDGRRLIAALNHNFAFDAARRFDDQFDVVLTRAPRQPAHAGVKILRRLAKSLALGLNGQSGGGIGWQILDAEMAGGIRSGCEIVAHDIDWRGT